MTTLTISARGQIMLPAEIRQRLGLAPGTQVELIEESGGIRLVVARQSESGSVSAFSGLVTAASKGKPRRLVDFDAASIAAENRP